VQVFEAAKPVESKASSRRPAAPPSGPRRLTWKEQREFEALEARIHALEAEQAALRAEVNASGDDYIRLTELAEQLHALEIEADAATERWLELAEEG
jgi:ATP-binding cassette subfamily F protein uup